MNYERPSRSGICDEINAQAVSPLEEKEVSTEDEGENERHSWNKPCENVEGRKPDICKSVE